MAEEPDCGCHGDTMRAERDPVYRRALWIVVILSISSLAVKFVFAGLTLLGMASL